MPVSKWVIKAAKVKTEWREAAPSGYYLRKSDTGYINSDLFYESAEKFVEFLKEKKILIGQDRALLLLDLHRFHLFNLKFLEYMKANRVDVCSFPHHCTLLMQPVDDAPFGSFKIEYQRSLLRINRLDSYMARRCQRLHSSEHLFLHIQVPLPQKLSGRVGRILD